MPSGTMPNVTVGAGSPDIASGLSPFPDSRRVLYRQNPLIGVVCQVRFAPVLKIESDLPAVFQESIRAQYPLLRERNEVSLELTPGVPPDVSALLSSHLGQARRHPGYDFISSNDEWTLTLNRDSLTLTAKHYEKWEIFKAYLEGPLNAMVATYAPAFFTRVSLRYQNLIQRSKLGLDQAAWADLLRPHILGLLGPRGLDVIASQGAAVVRFGAEQGQVTIRHGLVQSAENKEECYLIDSDFYTEQRMPTDGALKSLNFFNAQSGRLFRWCIDDRLHNAMDPQPVSDAD
jgi:uncharacterized protein (TIGR04255 family)